MFCGISSVNALSAETRPREKGNGDETGFDSSTGYNGAEKKRFKYERKQDPDNYMNRGRKREGKSWRRANLYMAKLRVGWKTDDGRTSVDIYMTLGELLAEEDLVKNTE